MSVKVYLAGPEVFLPLGAYRAFSADSEAPPSLDSREAHALHLIGRLRAGTTDEAAEAVVWPTPRSVSFYRRAGFGSETAPLGMDLAGD